MAVSVTNTSFTRNTDTAPTANDATADTDDLAEVFTFTPKVAPDKYLICIKHTSSAGAATYSIAVGAGTPHAALAAKTGTVSTDVEFIQCDGSYVSASGTIVMTITPYTSQKLKSDHALTAYGLQLA